MADTPDQLEKLVKAIASLGEDERRRVLVKLADDLAEDPRLNGERDLYRRIRQLVWRSTYRVAPGIDEAGEVAESLRFARELAENSERGQGQAIRDELKDPIESFRELRFSEDTIRRLEDKLADDRQ
ncbi:MAG: hypothetical protein AAGB51_02350 [Planctomycetota bacterium]